MQAIFYSVFLLILLFSQSFGTGGHCGTMQFAENFRNSPKKTLAKAGCIPETLYNKRNVHSKRTPRFIIYYVTEGPHRTRLAYVDSLAEYLEQAYKLHKETLGMKGIQGLRQTYHYEQSVPQGLYPVEVVDTGLLRDWEGEYSNAFGLTLPSNSSRATQIIIENDFLYGADCFGKESNEPFTSNATGVNYSEKWDLALKVTVFHELYHSFQATYFDFSRYNTFWLEASAAGVEEIGAPEVNDYINYLTNAFRNPGESMEDSKDGQEYGYATLYLFLHSELGPKFDSYIWNYFSKYPREKFAVQLARLADSLKIDAEDFFHEYAHSVFFSGHRASVEQANIWHLDQRKWPAWRIRNEPHRVLPATTIDFVKTANGQRPRTDSAKISPLEYGDSSIWVLSRLLESEFVPPIIPKEFTAYPNPWNPKKYPSAHFGNLPPKSKGVEIRSANGALVERIEYKTENEEEPLSWQPKKLPAPGVMYYRALPHGKNKVLIVEW